MGKDLWHNCLVVTQDLLESPETMSYICSKVSVRIKIEAFSM